MRTCICALPPSLCAARDDGLRGEPRPQQTADVTAPGATAGAHAEEENAIHLSEDMVRDLRISTALVAERSGRAGGGGARRGGRRPEPLRRGRAADRGPDCRRARRVERRRRSAARRWRSCGAPTWGVPAPTCLRPTRVAIWRGRRSNASARLPPSASSPRAKCRRPRRRSARPTPRRGRRRRRSARSASPTDDDRRRQLGCSSSAPRSPGVSSPGDVVLGQYADTERAAVHGRRPVARVADCAGVRARRREPRSRQHRHTSRWPRCPGLEFDGRVTQVGRQVDAGSRTVPVRIELANADGVLRPGMSANARLEVAGPSQTILAVPAAALQRVGERWLAFVPGSAAGVRDAAGRPRPRPRQ